MADGCNPNLQRSPCISGMAAGITVCIRITWMQAIWVQTSCTGPCHGKISTAKHPPGFRQPARPYRPPMAAGGGRAAATVQPHRGNAGCPCCMSRVAGSRCGKRTWRIARHRRFHPGSSDRRPRRGRADRAPHRRRPARQNHPLTPRGHALVEQVEAAAAAIRQQILADISDEELAITLGVIERICAALTRAARPGTGGRDERGNALAFLRGAAAAPAGAAGAAGIPSAWACCAAAGRRPGRRALAAPAADACRGERRPDGRRGHHHRQPAGWLAGHPAGDGGRSRPQGAGAGRVGHARRKAAAGRAGRQSGRA